MTAESPAQGIWPHDVTILIADDHHLVRDGLRLMVGAMFPHARLVEAADGAELMRQARRLGGHALALVDLNMPGMDRGAMLAALAREFPGLRVVVVSALTSPDVVRRALALPTVHAFVPKSADTQRMRRALDAALRGEHLAYDPPPEESEPPADAGLTPRMQEIRLLLRQGMSNKAIAQRLHLSEGTVKNYMTDIFRVLSVSNRTQAAQYNTDTS
ncbi:response regulator transcription factor [Oryzisolibacter sp. LB2S]|uniref:response regulator transcription factor n=1 Tax=Alicycliphilus soli TaxID=3228789 RepID=UPI00345B07D2